MYSGCKTVAHKKPQASNKKDPSCPIKMMTIREEDNEDDDDKNDDDQNDNMGAT